MEREKNWSDYVPQGEDKKSKKRGLQVEDEGQKSWVQLRWSDDVTKGGGRIEEDQKKTSSPPNVHMYTETKDTNAARQYM